MALKGVGTVGEGNLVRAHCYAELAISSRRWPKPSPVLIAPIHRGWPG